jgi:hypothetical protein
MRKKPSKKAVNGATKTLIDMMPLITTAALVRSEINRIDPEKIRAIKKMKRWAYLWGLMDGGVIIMILTSIIGLMAGSQDFKVALFFQFCYIIYRCLVRAITKRWY